MNWKFVFRGSIFASVALAIGLVLLLWLFNQAFLPPPAGPTPPPPTIEVPSGHLPRLHVGLQEFAKYQGETYVLVGCGFFFALDDGTVIGATTAHSLNFGRAENPLERIAFRLWDQSNYLVEMDALHGDPGKPRLGRDLTVDYVLLDVDEPVDPDFVLAPDPRGGPQLGERVALFSGLGGDPGVFSGTVYNVDRRGSWVIMDENFSPAMMSGSPFVSLYTGNVVGMAISASHREGRLMIGMHPIGSLIEKAEVRRLETRD